MEARRGVASGSQEDADRLAAALRTARDLMVPSSGPRPISFEFPDAATRWVPSSIELLTDILTTAAEGGISYWASIEVYHHDCPPHERRVELRDDTNARHRVDLYTIDDGLCNLAVASSFPPGSDAILWSSQAVSILAAAQVVDGALRADMLDEVDYDAGFADAVVQMGLFGSVVYG